MSDCRFGVSPVNYPDPDPDIGNGADPDQTPQNVASDQGLHSLLTGNYI